MYNSKASLRYHNFAGHELMAFKIKRTFTPEEGAGEGGHWEEGEEVHHQEEGAGEGYQHQEVQEEHQGERQEQQRRKTKEPFREEQQAYREQHSRSLHIRKQPEHRGQLAVAVAAKEQQHRAHHIHRGNRNRHSHQNRRPGSAEPRGQGRCRGIRSHEIRSPHGDGAHGVVAKEPRRWLGEEDRVAARASRRRCRQEGNHPDRDQPQYDGEGSRQRHHQKARS